ncbi:MAG: chromosome segregation protein SMC [Anderseniella sp.]|jgi:chromosome segregation protein|nr:chromosome segregation protein SMC [Anderseniella sp.]
MKFSKLRLSGFKSFVEPTELVIKPGLTGIVGPNGCGKSNLLEALRWVMGESSYKSMRGAGMEDVIFSGTSSRPSRNMAEVMLTLDNEDRTAPPAFNQFDQLDISRRIERDAGSAYRINGKDVRARDVQLLFADASTGARSPALVRQGQIGEIINSKPQARRRILEEAAGITGLHTRRHEAELKLRAAETNLERLEDVLAQLENQLQSLKRQARQAIRYKELSAEIRRLEAAGLYLAWKDAGAAVEAENRTLNEFTRVLGEQTRAVSEMTRMRDQAAEGLPKLRETEAVRAAVLQRLTLEREGLEREEQQALDKRRDLEGRIEQINRDLAREKELLGDTDGVMQRLAAEQAQLEEATRGDGDARAAAAKALQAEADKLAAAQAKADEANAKLSDLMARHNAIARQIAEVEARVARDEADLARTSEKHAAIVAETGGDDATQSLSGDIDTAVASAAAAETAATMAETSHQAVRARQAEAHQAYDEARRKSEALTTEVRTLTKLLHVADDELWPPLIDALKVETGYETALGAALGDDIDAPADEAAPVHWRALPELADAPALPAGLKRLADVVKAPPALARRLNMVAIVSKAEGAKLQRELKPGQRLVSLEGDLWRWDGYTAAADAPTAAAKRLAERNRLVALQAESALASAATEKARTALEKVREEVRQAEADERNTRQAWREATAAVEVARKALSEHERVMGERMRQASVLEETARRIEAQLGEAREALSKVKAEQAGLPDTTGVEDELRSVRATVDQQRATYTEVRAAHDGLERDARARAQRLAAIETEKKQWAQRAERANGQIGELEKRAEGLRAELGSLADLPKQFEVRRTKLLNAAAEADKERQQAADALAEAENALKTRDGELRDANEALVRTREEHARAGARSEAAEARVEEARQRIAEALQCKPEDVAARAGIDADKLPPADEAEQKLASLKDQRERLGAVNLRAEEEATEISTQVETMITERDDLVQAIGKLRHGISSLNREGRTRLLEAFDRVNANFSSLFETLFGGGKAELKLIESDDPLEAGLELIANPPGKKPTVLSLLSGGEQALTAMALIFAVFMTNPSPICVLDEVDAPLDDHNVERFCNLLDAMLERTETRFLIITHHGLTMARMHRLFGVTMMERGVSQLVSVDLETAEGLREAS